MSASRIRLKTADIDPTIAKQLVDKMYEKRKAAALELEKCVTMFYAFFRKRNALPLLQARSGVSATGR